MELQIDSAEQGVGFNVLNAAEKEGYTCSIQKEPVADYIYPEMGIAIERKEIGDLFNSQYSDHLTTQLLDMKQFPNPFLIIHGTFSSIRNKSRHFDRQVAGMLASYECQYAHLRCIKVDTLQQFIETVILLPKHVEKGEKTEVIERHRYTKNRRDANTWLFSVVPGMGPQKIEKWQTEYPFFDDFKEAYFKGEIGHGRKGKTLPKVTEEFLDQLKRK